MMNSTRKNEIEAEIADILYFVIRFAQLNQIDLSDAINKKLEENTKKYPVNIVKGNNKKYNEYD